MPFEVGWFSTGRDNQARSLLQKTHEAVKKGEIRNLNIPYVFSNREKGENKETDKFIRLVERMGIPFVSFSSKKFKPGLKKKGREDVKKGNPGLINRWRTLYDKQVMEKIQKYRTAVVFLAGYMLVLSQRLCEKFPILNLHPALPGGPKGTWQQVIWKLIEKREKTTGAMIHRVTTELDAGPAVTYCRFSLKGEVFNCLWERMEHKLKSKNLAQIQHQEEEREPLFRAIREEQKKREIPLIIATLHLLAEGRLNMENLKQPLLVELQENENSVYRL